MRWAAPRHSAPHSRTSHLSAALEMGQLRDQGLLQAVSYGSSGQSPAGYREWLLVLEPPFQLGHGLLQVLYDEIHISPGGTAAHAEPDRIPGHVHRNAAAQQHWGWPAEEGEHRLLRGLTFLCAPPASARPSSCGCAGSPQCPPTCPDDTVWGLPVPRLPGPNIPPSRHR